VWAYVQPALQWLAAAWNGVNWAGGLAQLRDAVNVAGQLIYSLVETLRRLLTGQSATAFDPLRGALVNVLTLMATAWDRFAADAVAWGWNLVVQIANGIIGAARSVLAGAMTYLGNFIGLFLKPGSPPKQGPLSQIAEWGKGVMAVFVGGFKNADFSVFRESLAPIKAALQGAVQAGTLDEAGFATTFAAVRQDVSQLISVFRQTGEISEAVLGGIAEKLGEGGAELTKFLRLQLRYQKAQESLADVQAEVAAAEKRGFVPAALRAKLQSAEDAADAAKDELDWQKEYLAVQEESVDLQTQLVKALEKMANALEKVSDAGGLGRLPKAEVAGGAGDLVAPETPFTSTLGGLTTAPLSLDIEGGEELQQAIGGVSAEFQAMRQKVEGWLKLPVEDKIRTILDAFSDATGIDLAGQFDSLLGWIEGLKKTDLGQALSALFTQGLDVLRTNGPAWAQKLGSGLLDLVLGGLANLQLGFNRLYLRIYDLLLSLVRAFLNILTPNAETGGRSIGSALGTLFGKAITFLTETLPEWQAKLRELPGQLLAAVATWIVEKGPDYARQWAASVKDFVGKWVEILKAEGPGWVEGLTEFARAFLVTFVVAFVENAPEDLQEMVVAGIEFVAKIKQGLANAWDLLAHVRDKVKLWVTQVLFNFALWIINLSQTGQKIVDTIKGGISAAWDLLAFLKVKFTALVQTLVNTPGDLFDGLLRIGNLVVGKVKAGIDAAWDLFGWLSGKISALWDGLLLDTGWQERAKAAGIAFVNNLKAGIAAAWSSFITWLKAKLGILADYLPGSEPKRADSPLRGLSKRGAALVENFAAGIDFSTVQRQLRAELATLQSALATAAPGLSAGVTVYMDGGMEFPNVRNGRDAAGFRDALRRQTLEAAMRGKG